MDGSIIQDSIGTPGFGGDYLLEKKLEVMLDINNKKISQELKGMQDTILRLNNEISELKKQLNGSRVPKIEVPIANFEAPEEVTVADNGIARVDAPAPRVSAPSMPNGGAIKPRYGSYKPEDVSIGKFFYFGGKK